MTFFGPEIASCQFQGPKSRDFQGPPLPMALVMELHPSNGELAVRWAHSPVGEGVGESQFRRADVHCGTLHIYIYIYILCAPPDSLLSPSAIKVNGSLSAIRPYTRVKTKHVSSFLQKALAIYSRSKINIF